MTELLDWSIINMKKVGDRVVLLKYPVYGMTGQLMEEIKHEDLTKIFWLVRLDIPTINAGQPISHIAIADDNMRLENEKNQN
jgi:hypothetical protein